MHGSKDLDFLLVNMKPEIVPGEFVFSSVSKQVLQTLSKESILTFHEREGITVILQREIADKRKIQYQNRWGLITLNIHSDLSAVGFIAEITRVLATASISVNVVSAYYHDHLFVPYERVNEALEILEDLSKSIKK